MLTKTIVFIGIGVGIGVILLLFFLLTHLAPKIEIQEETLLVSPRVFCRRSMPPQETLKAFQKSKFYRTIVDNNLFRPLGWTPPRPREPYRLIGTLIPTDANTPKQAILQRTSGGRTTTVLIGDQLDKDTTVTDIHPQQVTLEKAGHPRTLKLNTDPLDKMKALHLCLFILCPDEGISLHQFTSLLSRN